MQNAYRWIVAFDVAPEWVADGFTLSDATALDMLSEKAPFANVDTELAAAVISAPAPLRIVREQGYTENTPGAKAAINEVLKAAPMALGKDSLDSALIGAINLLDSVAFVREEGDDTADVLAKLRAALELVRGPAERSEA